eukprot:TRINITY_DN2866_c0_g1_i2.p2 TRINITY_DN2866_c0_g1~~TRINITY_DN2866_c0_g1_i2.p2  ORF type:complete len:278 (+),score=119.22 TRINITY_DN2866_c0_g1_i2:78-836(+)
MAAEGETIDYQAKFAEVTALSIMDQAKYFLRSFVNDFRGRFDDILDTAVEFTSYAPDAAEGSVIQELDEQKAHLFLERRGETTTVIELRDALTEIDLDKNHNVALIEYLLWKHKYTLTQLFTPPEGGGSEEALKALEEAIAAFEEVLEAKQARSRKMKELEELAEKGGVKGLAAKNELEQMKAADQLEANRKEVTAAAAKRRAEKAVGKGDAYEEEERKRQAELKKKQEEEERIKAEKREAMRKRAAMFEGK